MCACCVRVSDSRRCNPGSSCSPPRSCSPSSDSCRCAWKGTPPRRLVLWLRRQWRERLFFVLRTVWRRMRRVWMGVLWLACWRLWSRTWLGRGKVSCGGGCGAVWCTAAQRWLQSAAQRSRSTRLQQGTLAHRLAVGGEAQLATIARAKLEDGGDRPTLSAKGKHGPASVCCALAFVLVC